jgi:hypothetical protein
MKEMALELLDVIFVPKMIGKQLVLAVALQTGMVRAYAASVDYDVIALIDDVYGVVFMYACHCAR